MQPGSKWLFFLDHLGVIGKPMGNRRKAREFAIKVLFHMEFNPGVPKETFKLIVENFGVDPSIQSFAEELVLGVYENKKNV